MKKVIYLLGILMVIAGFSFSQTLTITNPSGAVTWELNSTHLIQWTYGGSGDIMIQLYQSGSPVGTIYNGANSGSYSWTINHYLNSNPIATGSYKLRVRSKLDSSKYAEVDLTIINSGGTPSTGNVTITTPSSSSVSWALNSTHLIQWTYGGTGGIMIQLYQSGSPVGTIYNGANSGSYSWTINHYLNSNPIATGSYKLRVRSKDDSSKYDEVDLTITGGGSSSKCDITFTTIPTSVPRGKTLHVEWSYSGCSDHGSVIVKVYKVMSKECSNSFMIHPAYTKITTGNSFSWNVPANISKGLYKIKITGSKVNTKTSPCINITDLLNPSIIDKFKLYSLKPIRIPDPEPDPWWKTRIELSEVINRLRELFIGVTTDFGEVRERFGIVLEKDGRKISLVNIEHGRTKWFVKHDGETAEVSLRRFSPTKGGRLSVFNAKGLKIQVVNLKTGEVIRTIPVQVER